MSASPSTQHGGADPAAEFRSRIMLRPIGSSLPLGFLALAGASLFISGLQLGWVPTAQAHQVALAILVFAVPMQLVASVFGFLARDSVGGAGNSLLAGCWLALSVLLIASPPRSNSVLTGLVGCFAGVALIVPGSAAALGKRLASIIIFAAASRFLLTGAFEFAHSRTLEEVSGWWGVAVCALGLYGALAFEIEDTLRRPVLPVGRRGAGLRALTGDVADALDRVQHEAGVREQL